VGDTIIAAIAVVCLVTSYAISQQRADSVLGRKYNMYITLRELSTKRIHVAAAQPGHALCGVTFINMKSTVYLIPLIGMATQDEVIHLENICPSCKEEVNPQRCKLITSVYWHDCGHCQGPQGRFCNGTLNGHKEGKFDHEFQTEEFWSDEMNKELQKLRR